MSGFNVNDPTQISYTRQIYVGPGNRTYTDILFYSGYVATDLFLLINIILALPSSYIVFGLLFCEYYHFS